MVSIISYFVVKDKGIVNTQEGWFPTCMKDDVPITIGLSTCVRYSTDNGSGHYGT